MDTVRSALEDCLAETGGAFASPWIAIVALLLVVSGAVAFGVARRSRTATGGGVLAIVIGVALVAGGGAPTPAVAADACAQAPSPTPSATLVLEPLVAPDILLMDFEVSSPGSYRLTVAMDSLGITTPNAGASVDWATVDLQPDVPDIQHTASVPLPGFPGEFAELVYDPATRELAVKVNWSSTPGSWVANFVVSDTLGASSNTAEIRTGYPA